MFTTCCGYLHTRRFHPISPPAVRNRGIGLTGSKKSQHLYRKNHRGLKEMQVPGEVPPLHPPVLLSQEPLHLKLEGSLSSLLYQLHPI